MFSIFFNWTGFNLCLPDVETWLRANAGVLYTGCSASTSQLELHFTSEPEQTVKDAITAYWEALTHTSPEATRYLPQAGIEKRISDLKAGLVTKTWDTMSVAERKIATNQAVTRDDLGL